MSSRGAPLARAAFPLRCRRPIAGPASAFGELFLAQSQFQAAFADDEPQVDGVSNKQPSLLSVSSIADNDTEVAERRHLSRGASRFVCRGSELGP